jgi:dTDP-glucose 4,6-dehydratase
MRKLLVTGGAGFIGANFVHYWKARHPGDLIVVLDALTYAGNRANIARMETRPDFRFVMGDICDRTQVAKILRDHAIDTVVHFAAETHVDRSIVDPDSFVRTNVLGTHSLLEASREFWLNSPKSDRSASHRFHHVSTDEVYGSLESGAPPFVEDSSLKPNSPYAASKAGADLLVRSYHRTYGLQVTISNCSNNYGPFQFPEKLVALTIINVLQGRRIPIYGDGKQIRDWLYVFDHCRALEHVLDSGRPGATYNIGGWTPRTNLEVVHSLCELIDEVFAEQPSLRVRFPDAPPARGNPSSTLLSHVEDRPGHDRRYAIDPTLLGSELGFQPEFTFENGLRRTVLWYVEHDSWWRPIFQRSDYNKWLEVNYCFRTDGSGVNL